MTAVRIIVPFAILLILFGLWAIGGWTAAGIGAVIFGTLILWAMGDSSK